MARAPGPHPPLHTADGGAFAWVALLALAPAFFVASGCSDPTLGQAADAQGGFTLGGPDTINFVAETASSEVIISEVAQEDVPATVPNCEFPATPQPGQVGATCTGPGDCDSGYCVETATGKACSQLCVTCCPSGFQCAQVAGSTDTTFICTARALAACRPCKADAECAALDASALCVAYGDAGRFCGGGCDFDSECAKDFACKAVSGTTGAGKQCVRQTGECGCSTRSVAEGAATTCANSNAAGSCGGVRKCGLEGLSACDAASPATETCNGADDDCDGATDEAGTAGCTELWLDADGDGDGAAPGLGGKALCLCKPADGYGAADAADCNDGDKAIHSAATEVCNGVDDDCNTKKDEGFPDGDGDGLADCVDPDDDDDGTVDAADCAPLDLAIGPSVTEACNGKDDDCDGATDEEDATGCGTLWLDGDGDGFGKAKTLGGSSQCLCKPAGLYTAATGTDCDDSEKAVQPAAVEACNNVDDDCDADIDEGCDDDKDGWCDAAMVVTGDPAVCPKGKKDCNDADPAIHPSQVETCGNALDDDCDGVVDSGVDANGCTKFYQDGDKDGFGVFDSQCLCAPVGLYTAGNNKDCDDGKALVNPKQPEVCGNGKDDNCSGQIDEEDASGCENWFADKDNDGFGSGNPVCLCGASDTFTTKKSGDCDDGNSKVSPASTESCNGVDDNCQDGVDEQDAIGCAQHFADADKDGFGDSGKVACVCKATATFVTLTGGDCNDAAAKTNPGAQEACDGLDDDCDGKVDEQDAAGCTAYWVDGDGDGFGDVKKTACLCAMIGVYNVKKGGDCDDDAVGVHPLAAEACDGIDNNCNGKADEQNAVGCFPFLIDVDEDGFGQTGVTKCTCKAGSPYTATQGGDCDDAKSAISPKAIEICDGYDNNCDGVKDNAGADGCTPFFVDKDGDGHGTYFAASKCMCEPKAPYTAPAGGDCDDNDGNIFPQAKEFCDNKDTDCDGIKDPKGATGCKVYYADGDQDGYGITNLNQCTCSPDSIFTAAKGGDCNDQVGAVNPGVNEVCNGVDDNCNGIADDGAGGQTYYQDSDGDGYGVGSGKSQCGPGGGFTATKAGDCHDGDGGVHPGAAEIQCNNKDDNCDGVNFCPSTHICDSKCGGNAGVCWCDSLCKSYGDCCNAAGTGIAGKSCSGSTCTACK